MKLDEKILQPFATNIWCCTEPVTILGMHLSVTMSIFRLADQSLLVYSPISLNPQRRAAIDELGAVRHLYAPNLFHHLHIGEWITAYPTARVHAPLGLAKKRPDLRIDRVHGSTVEPSFAAAIEEIPIEGCRLQECGLFHRPSNTLVVADLVHNIGRPQQAWAAFYTRMMGFYDRVALSRIIRWSAFNDRPAARRAIDGMLALPFERVIVGHGEPLAENAKTALAAAYEWLPSREIR